MPIPDEYLIKKKFDIPGGGFVEVHDSRVLQGEQEGDIFFK